MKTWLAFLTETDGRSLYEENGVVSSSNKKRQLINMPDGWDKIVLAWERVMSDHGMGRNYTVPHAFYRSAARILKTVIYKQNIDREIYFQLYKLSLQYAPPKYRWLYKFFYKGQLDLPSFKEGESKVTINMMEGGISKKLKAARGTTFEFPMNDPETIRVKMDGIPLTQKLTWLIPAGTLGGIYIMDSQFLNKEGEAHGAAAFSVFGRANLNNYNYSTGTDYFFSTSQAINNVRMHGTIKLKATTNMDLAGQYLKTNKGREIQVLIMQNMNAGQVYEFAFDITFNAQKDENFFFQGIWGDVIFPVEYLESTFSIEFASRYRETFVRAYKPDTLLRKLAFRNTGSENNALSNELAGCTLCLAPGDEIRGIPGAALKTSLNQFIEFAKVTRGCGMGIEKGKIRIEPYAHFYDTSNPIHLGKAKKLNVAYFNEVAANTLKIGYHNEVNDDVNGKYSFNNTHLYTLPQQSVVKELSLICPYIADPYTIELTRINYEGKTTTDSNRDNKVFILNIDLANPQQDADGTYYLLKRTATVIDGLPDVSKTSIFNVDDLTIKQILERHQAYINSLMHGFVGREINFETTEQNRALKTVSHDEDANVIVGKNKLFQPYLLEFEADVPDNLPELMEENPNRCFSLEDVDTGEIFLGFSKNIAISPDDNAPQNFTLISGPDNDLTKRI